MAKEDIFKVVQSDINNANIDEKTKNMMLRNIAKLKDQKINIMITGSTGCGKSSTINALFDIDIAKVGQGVDPETQYIAEYELDNLVLWDSPGLGDGKEQDIAHSKAIISKLNELDSDGKPLIDLILVILDASIRDYGTSFELINEVIIPAVGERAKDRVLVALNQADIAMKGRGWNHIENKPEPELEKFLNEKVVSVKRRIKESTGVDIEPIFYSAGYKDGDAKQNPYNLSKLLYFIVSHTPSEKRVIYANNVSSDSSMWKSNDTLRDYNADIQKSIFASVVDGARKGADIGGEIGSMFGGAGKAVGSLIGGTIGAIGGFLGGFFGW
nr:GTPase [uncultured Campylobacter sp.]